MKKTWKPMLAWLLTLTLLLSLCTAAAPAFAADGDPAAASEPTDLPPLTASGTCGDNITWTLKGGTLTISGTGAVEPMDLYPWIEAIDTYAADYACGRVGLSGEDMQRLDAIFFGGELTAQVVADVCADYYRTALAQMNTLVVGEGITKIPSGLFGTNGIGFTAIDLPSTLTEISDYNYDVDLLFARTLIIRNPDFDANQLMIHGSCESTEDEEDWPLDPPEDYESFLDAFITWQSYAEPLQNVSNYALYRLSKVYEFLHADELCASCAIYNYNYDGSYSAMSEDEFLQTLNDFYHANEPSLDTFTEKAIARINEVRGTNFTSLDDFYVPAACNCGENCCKDGCTCVGMAEGPAFRTAPGDNMIGGARLTEAGYKLESLNHSFALGNPPLDSYQSDDGQVHSFPLIPVPWLTVYGYAGSTAETACETSGVNFVPMIGAGTCGDNITWMLADGTLTINGTGEVRRQTREVEETYQTWDSDTQTMVTCTETNTKEYYPWAEAIEAYAKDYILETCGIDISDVENSAAASFETLVAAYTAYYMFTYDQIKRIVVGEGITAVSGYLTGGISDGIGTDWSAFQIDSERQSISL